RRAPASLCYDCSDRCGNRSYIRVPTGERGGSPGGTGRLSRDGIFLKCTTGDPARLTLPTAFDGAGTAETRGGVLVGRCHGQNPKRGVLSNATRDSTLAPDGPNHTCNSIVYHHQFLQKQ